MACTVLLIYLLLIDLGLGECDSFLGFLGSLMSRSHGVWTPSCLSSLALPLHCEDASAGLRETQRDPHIGNSWIFFEGERYVRVAGHWLGQFQPDPVPAGCAGWTSPDQYQQLSGGAAADLPVLLGGPGGLPGKQGICGDGVWGRDLEHICKELWLAFHVVSLFSWAFGRISHSVYSHLTPTVFLSLLDFTTSLKYELVSFLAPW